MYPKFFPKENKSNAEKKVFEYFKTKAPATWQVIHSFRLPEHLRVVFGESDFIVVAPEFGVFTLEIKGGGVGFDGSNWAFIDRNHNITYKQRGPFQQAYEGMFEVEKIIVDKLGSNYNRTHILYGYGVIFTDEDSFPVDEMVEDKPWRLAQNTGELPDYTSFIKKLDLNFRHELKTLGKRQPEKITTEDAKRIVSALRPEIECVAPLKSFIDASEDDVIRLTDQQFNCLDDIAANKRVVVLGGAGTGKTLIAVKDAMLAADEFEKVGVFCYNTNLAQMIKRSITNENIQVFSWHKFLFSFCKDDFTQSDVEQEGFFEFILPEFAKAKIKNANIKFDKIIVDEFQDLCTETYLEVFDVLLDGGLFDGRFTFYGDFARQAIYSDSVDLELLENHTYYSKKILTVNCRNTRYIGNELVNVTGYDESKYLLKIDGEPVDYYSYESREDEHKIFKEIIKELQAKHIQSEQIIVLSPHQRGKSLVGEVDPEKYIIGDYGENPKAYMALFSTVQSFKGLESEIVILTDIETYDDAQLMYVALSRARSKMYVLESKEAAKNRKRNLVRR